MCSQMLPERSRLYHPDDDRGLQANADWKLREIRDPRTSKPGVSQASTFTQQELYRTDLSDDISFPEFIEGLRQQNIKNSKKKLKVFKKKIDFDEEDERKLKQQKNLKKFAEKLLDEHPDFNGCLDFKFDPDRYDYLFLIKKLVGDFSEIEVYHRLKLKNGRACLESSKKQVMLEFLQKVFPKESQRFEKWQNG